MIGKIAKNRKSTTKYQIFTKVKETKKAGAGAIAVVATETEIETEEAEAIAIAIEKVETTEKAKRIITAGVTENTN